MVKETNIEVMLDTMVLEIEEKIIHAINTEKGYLTIEAESIVKYPFSVFIACIIFSSISDVYKRQDLLCLLFSFENLIHIP